MQRENYIAGRPPTTPLSPSEAPPLPQAIERDASMTRSTMPDITTTRPTPRPSVAVPANNVSVDDILGSEDEEDERRKPPTGLGPRLIVLHDAVQGHARGEVVWASDLLGLQTFMDATSDDAEKGRAARARIKAGLTRLIRKLGAVREATPVEAGYERVIFVEDMAQAEATIIATQNQLGQLADENERLRRQLEEANNRLTGQPSSTPENDLQPPPPIAPPVSTNAAPRPMRAVPVAPVTPPAAPATPSAAPATPDASQETPPVSPGEGTDVPRF